MAGQVKYFPDETLSSEKRLDELKSGWYSKQLEALKEPSLWELSKSQDAREAYRFLWLRTFHHPIAVRVDFGGDGVAHLAVKMASGAGGYAPGKLIQDETMTLKKERTDHFLSMIEKEKFWKLPSVDESTLGCDGAEWVIEGVKGGKYHLVDRWSPNGGAVRVIGLSFVKDLAKLRLARDEIY